MHASIMICTNSVYDSCTYCSTSPTTTVGREDIEKTLKKCIDLTLGSRDRQTFIKKEIGTPALPYARCQYGPCARPQ